MNKVTSYGGNEIDIEQYTDKPSHGDVREWKRKVNTLLHIAPLDPSGGPGSIYTFDSYCRSMADLHPLPGVHMRNPEPWRSFVTESEIRKSYLVSISEQSQAFMDLMEEHIQAAEAVIIDVTPPCDHSQQKAEFRKFCSGLLLELPEFNNSQYKKFKSSIMDPDFLWGSCNFCLENHDTSVNAMLVFNSRLTLFGPDIDLFNKSLCPAKIVKVSEQITKDFVHWLRAQESRPGYTYMP